MRPRKGVGLVIETAVYAHGRITRMTLQPPPLPRVDETNDVLVESIRITRIHVVSANRSITQHATIWNVWLNDLRQPFIDRTEAERYAITLAGEVGRPAWTRQDANQPWEQLPTDE